ncbi:MAG: sulfotransferase domain-containing protein [Tabrizicola sp.]|nr:sulfotransferase domain-containing protein [Tabrizicola sp.]
MTAPFAADIVIAAASRAGARRMQAIVRHLTRALTGEPRRILMIPQAQGGIALLPGPRYIVVVEGPRHGRNGPHRVAGHAPGDDHILSWWQHRRRENVLFIHMHDLTDDPATEIAVIAEHIGVTATLSACASIARARVPDRPGQSRRPRLPVTARFWPPFGAAGALPPDCAVYADLGRRALW